MNWKLLFREVCACLCVRKAGAKAWILLPALKSLGIAQVFCLAYFHHSVWDISMETWKGRVVLLSLAIFQAFFICFVLANVLNVYHVSETFTLHHFNKSWLGVKGNCAEHIHILSHLIPVTSL